MFSHGLDPSPKRIFCERSDFEVSSSSPFGFGITPKQLIPLNQSVRTRMFARVVAATVAKLFLNNNKIMPETDTTPVDHPRCVSGIEGLDDILAGGLPSNCFYLIQGDPGSGKTTLALQFLLEGVRRGEKVFYITLSETRAELLQVAHSHGWSLDDMPLLGAVGH